MALRAIHLCSGYGGMSLALRLAGEAVVDVCHVEREAYAAAILAARMEDGSLDAAPVWSDLHTFDGKAWRGCVDLVTSGLPCQPYSAAGQRRGDDDERALWPEFVRIVAECEPSMVFLENVPSFLHYAEPVWRELRGLGFEWAPPLLATASHFGAPHIRKRLFLLAAHPDRTRLEGRPGEPGDDGAERPAAERSGDGAADAHRSRLSREWQCWVFDAERQAFRHDAIRCGPGCSVCGSPWEAESPVVRLADGTPTRVDELRAIGNGVVPHVAAMAWRQLG